MTAVVDTDVAIIGAGPAGLFAVFECGMLKMKAVVIDALDAIGGQCSALYPEKPIYDIPAHPAIEAGDLVAALEKQAQPFLPLYLLGRRVETLVPHEGGLTLTTSAGDKVTAKAVIIAAGAGAFGPNRPPLEGPMTTKPIVVLKTIASPEQCWEDEPLVQSIASQLRSALGVTARDAVQDALENGDLHLIPGDDKEPSGAGWRVALACHEDCEPYAVWSLASVLDAAEGFEAADFAALADELEHHARQFRRLAEPD